MSLTEITNLMYQHRKEKSTPESATAHKEKADEILNAPNIETMRNLLKSYRGKLHDKVGFSRNHGHTFEELKEFLKKHLLSSIKNTAEQAFLLNILAKNLHQDSISNAAGMYYMTKASQTIISQFSEEKPLTVKGKKITTLSEPEEIIYLNCKGNKVSIREDARFAGIVDEDMVTHTNHPNDYIARINLETQISAKKDSKSRLGIFTLNWLC